MNKTIEIITAYQKGFGGAGGSQLVLPESLKSLPLYSLALVKSSIVRLGQDLPPDVYRFHSQFPLLPLSFSIAVHFSL